MLLIRTLIVVIMLSLTINVSAMAQESTDSSSTSAQSDETKESRKNAIKKEIQKRSEIEQRRVERFKALPEDIKIKIKDRKEAILESRQEIREMKPENRAELQALIEKWFSSLPLEKQSEIQIRIEGMSSVRDYKQVLREREAREIIEAEKAKAAKKIAEEDKNKSVKKEEVKEAVDSKATEVSEEEVVEEKTEEKATSEASDELSYAEKMRAVAQDTSLSPAEKAAKIKQLSVEAKVNKGAEKLQEAPEEEPPAEIKK